MEQTHESQPHHTVRERRYNDRKKSTGEQEKEEKGKPNWADAKHRDGSRSLMSQMLQRNDASSVDCGR